MGFGGSFQAQACFKTSIEKSETFRIRSLLLIFCLIIECCGLEGKLSKLSSFFLIRDLCSQYNHRRGCMERSLIIVKQITLQWEFLTPYLTLC